MNQLLSPCSLGNMQLRNRVVFLPFQTAYAEKDGSVSPQLLAYYKRMADSGAGLVIVEAASISHEAASGRCPHVRKDTVPGLKALASSIQGKGSKAFLQIVHAGRYANAHLTGPSPVEVFGLAVKELSIKEMQTVVNDFAQAATLVKEAGFDGVELHGAMGYLLASFISPRTNTRTDAYGGSPENRMRFPLEVAAAVRKAVGKDYPVGYRFIAKEYIPGGLTLEDSAIYAQNLATILNPAYLSVASGTYECYALPEMQNGKPPEMYMTAEAGEIKKAVPSIPVIAAGHLQTPANCEMLLETGVADLVGLARVLFADTDWVRKASGEITGTMRACVQCNNCIKQIKQGKPSFCSRWNKEDRERFLKDMPASQ